MLDADEVERRTRTAGASGYYGYADAWYAGGSPTPRP
jgi:hypothetical protein